MATKKSNKKVQEPGTEQAIENALGKTEQFLESNGKTALITLAVVVVLVGGFFGYKYLIQEPKQERASEAMFVAEQLFGAENYEQALNGDGNNAGFLEVIEQYGSTPQGRLAAHYAGISYLKLGDKENALEYLTKYKQVKGATSVIINAQNLGLQGDIYADNGDYKKAVEMFEAAIDASNNSLTAPYYLKKAGLTYMALGDNVSAKAAFQRIADEFATSLEARDVDKYLGELDN